MKLPFLLRLLVTFDSDDWNIPQNIAVTALHTYTATINEPLEFDLEHSSSSSDANYNGGSAFFVPSTGNLHVTLFDKDVHCKDPCDPGEYNRFFTNANGDNVTICLNCVPGTYCPGGCDQPESCPIGTASSPTLATDDSTCIACLAGYNQQEAGKTPCDRCPAGYKCPDVTGPAIECGDGTYSGAESTTCSDCEAGYSCGTPSAAPVACDAGYYALALSLTCTPCPAGQFCQTKLVGPTPCEDGYYSTGTATSCTACPAGEKCNNKETTPTTCSEGSYSTGTTTNCFSCPAGQGCSSVGTPPVNCEEGEYSILGSSICRSCPAV